MAKPYIYDPFSNWKNLSNYRRQKKRRQNKVNIAGVIQQVLKAGCSTPGWYQIREIHMNACKFADIDKCSPYITRDVLSELGFKQRRWQSCGGVRSQYVYVNLENPNEKAPPQTKHKLLGTPDIVRDFANSAVELKPDNVVSKADLYEAFINYCREKHVPSTGERSFILLMPKFLDVSSFRKIVKGRRVGFWRGAALKSKTQPD